MDGQPNELQVYFQKEVLWIIGNLAASGDLGNIATELIYEPYNLKCVLSEYMCHTDQQFVDLSLWFIGQLLSDKDSEAVRSMPIMDALCCIITGSRKKIGTYILSTVMFCAMNFARKISDSKVAEKLIELVKVVGLNINQLEMETNQDSYRII